MVFFVRLAKRSKIATFSSMVCHNNRIVRQESSGNKATLSTCSSTKELQVLDLASRYKLPPLIRL